MVLARTAIDRKAKLLTTQLQALIAECSHEKSSTQTNRLGLSIADGFGREDRLIEESSDADKRQVKEMLRERQQNTWSVKIENANQEEANNFWRLMRSMGRKQSPRPALMIDNELVY